MRYYKLLALLLVVAAPLLMAQTSGFPSRPRFAALTVAGVDMTPTSGTFTATLTGVSGSVTATATYWMVGNMVSCHIPQLQGTSNNTATTITGIPVAIRPSGSQGGAYGGHIDNSLTGSGGYWQLTSAGVLQLCRSIAAGGCVWTNSGTKGTVDGQTFVWRKT